MTHHESLALAARIAAGVAGAVASQGPDGPLGNRFALVAVCALRRADSPLTPAEVAQITGAPPSEVDIALRDLAAAPALQDGDGPLLVGPIERAGGYAPGPDRYAIRKGFDDDPAMRAFLAVVDAVKDDLNHRAAVLPPDHPSAYRPKKSRQ